MYCPDYPNLYAFHFIENTPFECIEFTDEETEGVIDLKTRSNISFQKEKQMTELMLQKHKTAPADVRIGNLIEMYERRLKFLKDSVG